MRILVPIIALLLGAGAAEAVDLTIVTLKGHVTFTAEDQWAVIRSESKPPVATMAFQLADPADEGTPHASNLILQLFDPSTEQGKKVQEEVGKTLGSTPPKQIKVGDWTTFVQQVFQGSTKYFILDARRQLADVTVFVRLAWPSLPGQPKGHEQQMRAFFQMFLQSVRGGMGPYTPPPGGVIRRPGR